MPIKKFKLKIPRSLLIILLLGFFLRIFRFSELFQYGHEQDLQAWIVKDILIDWHPRLIGQETSIPGLFIGPLYYYMLVPFFYFFNLDPRSSYIPITFISLATVISVYWVVSNLYGKTTGKIASYIYALSPTIIFLDRWIVPTQLTLLWTIWFYFVLVKFAKGEFQVAPILIILIALIWHIHIAFAPLLVLILISAYFGRKSLKKSVKKIEKRYLIGSVVIAAFLLLPLVAFEFRHNFQQVRGLLNANTTRVQQTKELREGDYKVEVITEYMNRVVWSVFLYQTNPKNPMIAEIPLMLFIFIGLIYFLYKNSKISKEELILVYFWMLIVFSSQFVSQRVISDYYSNNLLIISITTLSLTISLIYSNKAARNWILALGAVFLVYGVESVIFKPKAVGEFEDKNAVVEFIGKDVDKNKYPCVAINYIGNISMRYGYRYLMWKNNVSLVTSGNDVPVYSMVQPFNISEREIKFKSGDVGVISPQDPAIPDETLCKEPGRQLLPLNGFVN